MSTRAVALALLALLLAGAGVASTAIQQPSAVLQNQATADEEAAETVAEPAGLGGEDAGADPEIGPLFIENAAVCDLSCPALFDLCLKSGDQRACALYNLCC